MKTAISLPDPLFSRAEALAKHLGIPRSQLYARALLDYLDAHGAEPVTASLDAIYNDADSTLDGPIATAQARTVEHNEW